jgi:hypothetical protein
VYARGCDETPFFLSIKVYDSIPSWEVAWYGEKNPDLPRTVPPFLERYCPREHLDKVYEALEALEALGLGFTRPPLPHEELHTDPREGYDS